MEMIINSKLFAKVIKQAFEIDCHAVSFFDRCLIFQTTKYQQDITFQIHTRNGKDNSVMRFNHLKMIRLMDFLKLLPEQPIVIELEEDQIECKQFIIRF